MVSAQLVYQDSRRSPRSHRKSSEDAFLVLGFVGTWGLTLFCLEKLESSFHLVWKNVEEGLSQGNGMRGKENGRQNQETSSCQLRRETVKLNPPEWELRMAAEHFPVFTPEALMVPASHSWLCIWEQEPTGHLAMRAASCSALGITVASHWLVRVTVDNHRTCCPPS